MHKQTTVFILISSRTILLTLGGDKHRLSKAQPGGDFIVMLDIYYDGCLRSQPTLLTSNQ